MNHLMKSLTFVLALLANNLLAQVNWTLQNVSNSKTDVQHNGRYLLINKTNSNPLKYGKRSAASRLAGCINIVWGSPSESLTSKNFVNVVRQPGSSGPIKTGERVALRFEGGGYLNYETQKVGVNLGWVSSNTNNVPYIFEIRSQSNQMNQVVTTNNDFGIFCHPAGDWLTYCKRPSDPGINLGWPASCSGCERSGFDFLRDYYPVSKIIIGDVTARKLDGQDLIIWCQD